MKRHIIIYLRRSTDKGQKHSLKAQRIKTQRFCKDNNLIAVEIYEETASGKNLNRPVLQQALELSKRKKYPIVVASVDRIGRNAGDVINLLESFSFISVKDGIQANKFELQSSAIKAQQEVEVIGERTKDGLEAASLEGVQLGNPQIHDAQILGIAKIKQNADDFALKLEGIFNSIQDMSLKKQAELLNQAEVPTRRGGRWTAQSVKNLHQRLRNLK